MYALRRVRELDCVLVDVNTQHDFCDPKGAFPVANSAELIPSMRRVVAWAKRNHLPVVSSLESHRPLELSDSGTPIHCIDGSSGQRKLEFTLFATRTKLEVDNTFAVPFDLFHRWQQVIFSKRSGDLLLNPKADRLFSHLPVREYFLFGTGLEESIKAIGLALLTRGKKVTIIVDACGFWTSGMADLSLRQLAAKGATLTTSVALAERRVSRLFHYPIRRKGASNNGHKPSTLPREASFELDATALNGELEASGGRAGEANGGSGSGNGNGNGSGHSGRQ